MNQRRSKKLAKQATLEKKKFKPQCVGNTAKALPRFGNVIVGGATAIVPYMDHVDCIVSSETDRQPIKLRHNTNKGVRIISKILRNSGFDSLVDIGNAMMYKDI